MRLRWLPIVLCALALGAPPASAAPLRFPRHFPPVVPMLKGPSLARTGGEPLTTLFVGAVLVLAGCALRPRSRPR